MSNNTTHRNRPPVLEKDKIFFNQGEIVVPRHLNTPVQMVVKEVLKAIDLTGDGKPVLLGIVCYWFAEGGFYQEQTFNSKDIKHL